MNCRTGQVSLEAPQYRKHANLSPLHLSRVHVDVVEQLERQFALSRLLPDSLPTFEMPAGLPERLDTLDAVEGAADHRPRR